MEKRSEGVAGVYDIRIPYDSERRNSDLTLVAREFFMLSILRLIQAFRSHPWQ